MHNPIKIFQLLTGGISTLILTMGIARFTYTLHFHACRRPWR